MRWKLSGLHLRPQKCPGLDKTLKKYSQRSVSLLPSRSREAKLRVCNRRRADAVRSGCSENGGNHIQLEVGMESELQSQIRCQGEGPCPEHTPSPGKQTLRDLRTHVSHVKNGAKKRRLLQMGILLVGRTYGVLLTKKSKRSHRGVFVKRGGVRK